MTSTPDIAALPAEPLSTEQLKGAWLSGDEIAFGDPVLANAEFPFKRTYFPLGFAVEVTTNSERVLHAADQSWGSFTPMLDAAPIRLRVGVTRTESRRCPPTTVCRMRDHLVWSIADAENAVICDLAQGTAAIWVTDAAVAQTEYFRYFFLEAAAMSGISRHATAIHAGCVALDGAGILLCGDSGAGKSTLTYACTRSGWTYITDDGSYLVHGCDDPMVVGNCSQVRFRPTAEALFPELHGKPVIQRGGVGKPSIELPTNPGSAIRTARSATIRHIVFLNRGAATEELKVFPRAVARLYMQQTVHCMPHRVTEQMEEIERLLAVPIYELCYNRLDWATERLAALAREGR